MDKETIQILLDLLNPLHGEIDRQTYEQKVSENFDAPADAEYNVDITAQMDRDLTQAVMILENRLRDPQLTEQGVAALLRETRKRSNGCAQSLMMQASDELKD